MIPHTDYERLELLKEVECGDKVVIPVSLEHAEFMIKVAQDYIARSKKEMWDKLKVDKIAK
jgi:hypothetical protein